MPRKTISQMEKDVDKELTDFTQVAVVEGLTKPAARKMSADLLSTGKYYVMSTVVLSEGRKPTYELHVQRR